ncbi:replication endonuclease [Thalassotalea sp. 1_MG-2023]|uniref:replication endonuclease n=1 Tax=Thalassotalea sp. 1_MG-2023 TaxID=3062680 RepID=UPI0026E39157|nr:replication endonuclease [Thalassotalea sp. 1_MG-2023]MDO6426204.1 replication endonuclease [Thalassotalea sp. 1_MG-2023]
MRDQKVNLDDLNLSSFARGIISTIDDVRDHNFLALGLSSIPYSLQTRLVKGYYDRYNKKQSKAQYKANTWLRRTIMKLKPRFGVLFRIMQEMPLPWYILNNKDKTKEHAFTATKYCIEIMLGIAEEMPDDATDEERLKAAYQKVGDYAQTVQVSLQNWEKDIDDLSLEDMEVALLKAKCEKWWARKLKTVRARYLELLELATGQVGKDILPAKKQGVIKRKGISPYSSKQAQAEYIESQKSGRRFLKSLELQSDKGVVIDMIDAVDAGMANPENRRNELMLRIRETEELANEMGYVGVFYTMTCPGRYHPNSDKWDGSTPKQAQAYLVKTWSRGRSKLSRLGINYFGVRVAEPHADGCPHWHMMLFMPKNKVQTVNAILRKYFIEQDREELLGRYGEVSTRLKNRLIAEPNKNGLGIAHRYQEFSKQCRSNTKKTQLFKTYKTKRQQWGLKKSQGIKAKEPAKFYRTFVPRFEAKLIDSSIGSAASYLAKYISKNVDGHKVLDHEDDETGDNITVNPVLAWASTWGIRQFQFQGSPSVTVYRELRRVREPVQEETLERVRVAADTAQWKEFVKLMGGMCVGRNANFKTAYQQTPFGNDYGEVVKRVKGVFTNDCPIAAAANQLKGEFCIENYATLITRDTEWQRQAKGTGEHERLGLNNVSAADSSWTSGNNCTPCSTATTAENKLSKLGITPLILEDLKKGKRIKINDQIYYLFGDQLLSYSPDEKQELQKKAEVKHFAQVFARKAGRKTPYEIDYTQAKQLVSATFNHAENNGRTMPNATDWLYGQQLLDGEIEPDWWD